MRNGSWFGLAAVTALIIGLGAGCEKKPVGTTCSWGEACAEGWACNEPTLTCAPLELVEACIDLADGATCSVPGTVADGVCVRGICESSGCGHGLVIAEDRCGPCDRTCATVVTDAGGGLSKARAFHQATPLPGDRLLISGGLIATEGSVTAVAEGSGLLVTDALEILDPCTGQFVQPVVVGEPGVPRAFHSAFVLDGSYPEHVQVLLLGGVTQGSVPHGDGVVRVRVGPEQPLRLSPDPDAGVAPPMLLSIDFTETPPRVTRSSDGLLGWPDAYFQAPTFVAQHGFGVTGGAGGFSGVALFDVLDGVDLADDGSAEHYLLSGQLSVGRLAHTATVGLDGLAALVWGGNLNEADPVSSVAERVVFSPAPPQSTGLTLDATASTAATVVPTLFHTATLLHDLDVLVVGGFEIEGGYAINPSASLPLVRVREVGTDYRIYAQDAAAFTPVGYHAAVSLPDGQVLITGGSPSFVPGQSSCPSGDHAWTCSVDQALLYTPDAAPTDPGTLAPLDAGPLAVGRFGHTMTRLTLQTVLVVGGLNRREQSLYTVSEVESINISPQCITSP